MKIDVCSKKEQDYIIERLVEYNLSQVEAKQKENFIDLSKKIGKDDKIVAGIVARMYCWNVVYVDTLWVDSSYRGKKLGSLLLEEVENDAKSKGAKLIHLDTFDFQAKEFYEKQTSKGIWFYDCNGNAQFEYCGNGKHSYKNE